MTCGGLRGRLDFWAVVGGGDSGSGVAVAADLVVRDGFAGVKRAEGGILEVLVILFWDEVGRVGGHVSVSGFRGEKNVPLGLMVRGVYAVSTVPGVNCIGGSS